MGVFTVPIEIGNLEGTRFERLEALVDSGASHTRVPRSALQRLGITPKERLPFTIADESTIEYDVGDAPIRINGRTRYTPVVFGDDDSQPLLGATTLEIFHLGVDPLHQRLIPVTGLLMTSFPL
jgi:clan AA aspartic protease